MENLEVLEERRQLVMERIREIPKERFGNENLESFFSFCAGFLMRIEDTRQFLKAGGLQTAALEELEERNRALYADILPEHYEESYGNPAWAVRKLGEEYGRLLCFLYAELRSLIGFVYEDRLEETVIRMEAFAEVYAAFRHSAGQGEELPSGKEIREILYWFVSDYSDMAAKRRVEEQTGGRSGYAADRIGNGDPKDVRYLYTYGEYISRNEVERAEYMAGLPGETLALMADAYTEGYRRGFESAGKDLPRKKTVGLHYRLGFEPMLRYALENFGKLGLRPAVSRAAHSILDGSGTGGSCFYGGMPNRQFAYDHKDDLALFLDKNLINRRLEAVRTAYEKYKEEAEGVGGTAALTIFGETDFTPAVKKEALKPGREQNRLWTEYRFKAAQLRREYIPQECFTIAAFPLPETGPAFRGIFRETRCGVFCDGPGELTAVKRNDGHIVIMGDGRFVLSDFEEENDAETFVK